MGTPMRYGSGGKRPKFEKRYDYDLPASAKPKAQTTPTRPPAQPTPAQIDRQIATDNALAFKSDAEVVLVNLTLSAWTSRADLKRLLKTKNVVFDDPYLLRLLNYLLAKKRVASKGDTWKRN